jgi:hypothetical protein
MTFDEIDLPALKARVRYAHSKGYSIANAEKYAEALGNGEPPVGVERGSTEHLTHLIALVEANGGKPPVAASPLVVEEPVEAAPAEPVAPATTDAKKGRKKKA